MRGRRLFVLAAAAVFSGQPVRAAIEEQPTRQQPTEQTPKPAPKLTRPPQLLHYEPAAYPEALQDDQVGGEVVLVIGIDAEGLVELASIQSTTHAEFSLPAMAAAARFRFSPAEIDHKPAAIRLEYRMVFEPLPQIPDAIVGSYEPDKPKAGQAAMRRALPEPPPVNFAGNVREAGTRKPISGAVLSIDGEPVAETRADGAFAVRGVAPGERQIRVRGPFHQPYEVQEELVPGERFEVNYYLLPVSNNPYETVVRTRVKRREVAKVQLEREELSKVPGTFGDPVRVIENLPGMSRTPGGLGGALLVRGARPEDSAVFVDGVEVPLLYHFLALTSVVNAEFLERIDFYPGGFGARYGRATAGIVDVITRDLDCDGVHGSGSADQLDADGYLCAPAGTWTVAAAGRRSYVDLILPYVIEQVPREEDEAVMTLSPVYYDYQAKANAALGAHRLSIFAFGSDDKLKLAQVGSNENIDSSFGMHLTWHRVLVSHRLSLGKGITLASSVTPGYTRTRFQWASDDVDLNVGFDLVIWSIEWRETLTAELAEGYTLRGGVDMAMGRGDIHFEGPAPTEIRRFPSNTYDYTQTQTVSERMPGYEHAYWVELEAEPFAGFKAVPGLRLDRFDFHKTQHISVQPRLTLRYEIVEGSTVKAAYGRYEKLPEPNYLMEEIGNPALLPERSHHYIVGFEQQLMELVDLDLQLFYNARSRLPTPSSSTRFEDGQQIDERFSSDATGRSYGLEILLRRLATAQTRFYGWIAYTLSRSFMRDTIYSRNRGVGGNLDQSRDSLTEYLSPFDQTHILTIVGQWTLPWGLEVGMRYRFVSGNPHTPRLEGDPFFNADADGYGLDARHVERNSQRMPAFHQLDVRIDRTFTFDLWKLALYLEVINAYYAKNVEAYRYDYRYRDRAPVTLLPIIPMLGVKGTF